MASKRDKKTENTAPDEALFRNENGEPLSVEESFKEIESRIAFLENGDSSLEESFKIFKEGMELIKYTGAAISDVEKQVQIICEDGSLEEFE